MRVGDVIYAERERERQKHALISFLMFLLLSRTWNLIGVYGKRKCETWWKEGESEREGLLLVLLTLPLSWGHGRGFQGFLLSSLPEERILYPILQSSKNNEYIALFWFLPASLTVPQYSCTHSTSSSTCISMDCCKNITICFVFLLFYLRITSLPPVAALHVFLTPKTPNIVIYVILFLFSSIVSVAEETNFELLKFIYYLLDFVHYETKEVLGMWMRKMLAQLFFW